MSRQVLAAAAVLVFCSSAAAQQRMQFGTGAGYDYGVGLRLPPGFEFYSSGQTNLYTVDAYVGIPFGFLTIYPTYSYGLNLRPKLVSNTNGDYLPLGYGFSTPAAERNPGYLYGPDYYDLSSEAHITRSDRGAFVFLSIGPFLEIGSGYFRRRQSVSVTTDVLFDEYYLIGETDEVVEYLYNDTWWDHTETHTVESTNRAIPLAVQWRFGVGSFYNATRVTWWRSDGDRSLSIQYSLGMTF